MLIGFAHLSRRDDENGQVCFRDLPAGTYVVYVGAHQPSLSLYRPSTPDCYRVTLKGCDEACVRFGYCKRCDPTPCCEGDLHEALVGTAIWVGDCAKSFDLKARILNGCSCGSAEDRR